jgi:PAS domain S-box-containing protein
VRPAAHLLLVDDDPATREALSLALASHGYRVSTAGSRVALAAFDTGEYDLLLIDVHDADHHWLTVLDRVRQRFQGYELPVILLASEERAMAAAEGLDRGANEYLPKPVDVSASVARINTLLALREAERAARDSEARFTLAARGSNDGLWDWNLETDELYLSPRWKTLVGYDDETLESEPSSWFDRVHPDDVEGMRTTLAAHLARQTPFFVSEHRLRHRDEQYRTVLARGTAIFTAAGVPVRIAGSLTDLTDSRVSDPLTSLPNRALLADRVALAFARWKRRSSHLFAVLHLDLDRFTQVNERYGRTVGDRFLVAIARRLETDLRRTDLVTRSVGRDPVAAGTTPGGTTRLNGDEFTIVLEDLSHAGDAIRVAERLLKTVAAPLSMDGRNVFATASIGVAVSAVGYTDAEHLCRDAVMATEIAKSAGGGRCHLFEASIGESARTRLRLETDLHRALDEHQLRVFYEPVINLSTGEPVGFEALVRWQHPSRGLVQPGAFIGVAEETGLIVPIGRWVLREACRQIQRWQATLRLPPSFAVSVNLSPKEAQQPGLVDRIREVLSEIGLDPLALRVEITEGVMMTDPEAIIATLSALREMGVRVNLDDFGTGYSSLSYLHRLPADALKIDRSFVEKIVDRGVHLEIARTIVTLGHRLGLTVIAEGVETPEHLRCLRELSCEYAQGYLFARPMNAADAEAFLIRSLPPVAGADALSAAVERAALNVRR